MVHSVVGAWVKIGGGGAMSGSSGWGTYSDCPSAARVPVAEAVGPGSSRAERNTVCERISAITAITTTEPPITAIIMVRERRRARSLGSPRTAGPRDGSPGEERVEKSGSEDPSGCRRSPGSWLIPPSRRREHRSPGAVDAPSDSRTPGAGTGIQDRDARPDWYSPLTGPVDRP